MSNFYMPVSTGRIMWLGMEGSGRPHRFLHNNFSSVYRIFTKLSHTIPLFLALSIPDEGYSRNMSYVFCCWATLKNMFLFLHLHFIYGLVGRGIFFFFFFNVHSQIWFLQSRVTDFVHLKMSTRSERKFWNNIGTSSHDFR